MLIFTRNPELGKCKTRLAATIGDEAALEIYKFLLQHTVKITSNLPLAKEVYYSERLGEDDIWQESIYAKKLQIGEDLGARMHLAFKSGFERGYDKIVVIGSDLYELSEEDLSKAFKALETHDYVIGPAVDGGYYLLGMNTFKGKLFENKAWGTDTVLERTLEDLKDDKVKLLAPRNDVDVYEDIAEVEVFQPFLKTTKKR